MAKSTGTTSGAVVNVGPPRSKMMYFGDPGHESVCSVHSALVSSVQ